VYSSACRVNRPGGRRYEVKRLVFLFLFSALIGCGTPPERISVKTADSPSFKPENAGRLAIVANVENEKARRLIEDEFVKVLIHGGYTLSLASGSVKIQRERLFRRFKVSESEAARFGEILNVDAVVLVDMTRWEKLTQDGFTNGRLDVRVIDVQTSETLWAGSSSHLAYPLSLLIKLSRAVANSIPRRNDSEVFVEVVAVWEKPLTHRRIAVFADDEKPSLKRMLGDVATSQLVNKGYRVPARSEVEALSAKIEFIGSGYIDSYAMRFAELLGFPAVLIVTQNRYRGVSSEMIGVYGVGLSVRLIDVEKKRILYCASDYIAARRANDSFDYIEKSLKRMLSGFDQKD
jgi:hypothetical protein